MRILQAGRFRKLLALILPLAFFSGATGCDSATKANPSSGTANRTVPTLRVTEARHQAWPTRVRVQGSMVGDEEAVVGAKVVGRVKEVLVDRGTIVEEGQVLARLEPEEFDLRVLQAEAQLAQVRAKLGLQPGASEDKLDRMKAPPVVQEKAVLEEARFHQERARTLLAQKAIALEELQKYEMAHEVSQARFASSLNTVDETIALLALRKAELALAKQHQADAIIKAPFQGVVQERAINRGVFLELGHPVATLVRTHPLRFRAGVPEREAAHVCEGETILIHLEGEPDPLQASISRVSPALDLGSRSLMIEADVPNPKGRRRAGLFAQADIIVAPNARALAVPETAITEFAGVEKVWLVRDGKAAPQRVHTGRRERGLVEVLRGLKPGDEVVVEGDKGHAGTITIARDTPTQTGG